MGAPGVYGIKGIPSMSNYPGNREYHSMVLNPTQQCLYVFGGYSERDPWCELN